MKTIVVVGSLNVDLVASVDRMPMQGETITGRDFAVFPGGKGANQAVAAARLGGSVAMIGRLGNDSFGNQLRQALHEDSVNTGAILQVERPTGSAIILVDAQGTNSIIVTAGANASLTPEDIDSELDRIRNASVILTQLETPMETVVRLAMLAAELQVPIILDPAPARDLPEDLATNVTWLTPNETETAIILRGMGHSRNETSSSIDALEAVAQRLLATGARNVILKLGSRGVYLAGKDVPSTLVPALPVDAIDTTAAGDAFNGGFAYGLTTGMPPLEAARFACAVAGLSTTRAGAQPSMPRRGEVNKLLKQYL